MLLRRLGVCHLLGQHLYEAEATSCSISASRKTGALPQIPKAAAIKPVPLISIFMSLECRSQSLRLDIETSLSFLGIASSWFLSCTAGTLEAAEVQECNKWAAVGSSKFIWDMD